MRPVAIARLATPALWLGALVAAACARTGDTASADSTLARDLTLAASVGQELARPAVVPLADTAVTRSAPVVSPPAAAPEPRPVALSAPRRAPAPEPIATEPAPAKVAVTPPVAPAESVPSPDSQRVPDGARAAGAPSTASAAGPVAASAASRSGASRTFDAGTPLWLTTTQMVCSASSRVGDRVVATLVDSVTPSSSTPGLALAAGTNVVLEITSTTTTPDGRAHMELAARTITIDGFAHQLAADVGDVDSELRRQRMQIPGQSRAGTVGRGAMAGAVLGRIFGRSAKGTVIGAAAGAAAGAASTVVTGQYQGCLPRGAQIRLRLTGPLVVTASSV